jgi:2-oxoglutarate ferredoxin oxidoreductase subunit alpha
VTSASLGPPDHPIAAPVVDRDICKGCGICVAFCPFGHLRVDEELNVAGYHPAEVETDGDASDTPRASEHESYEHNFAYWCLRCRYCEVMCPDAAIRISGDVLGFEGTGVLDEEVFPSGRLGFTPAAASLDGASISGRAAGVVPAEAGEGDGDGAAAGARSVEPRVPSGKRILMKGNEALAEAALKAGCRAFFGYPITPASEITSYMARWMRHEGGVFLQSESEVATINMVFGAAAAGVRTMTASSSPGISLMSEGVSFLAGAEVPCLLVNVMRVGPGLGGIQPSQSDYFQATRGLGHGDSRVIVLAPANIQEMADLVFDAFELAEKYVNPVMILADGILGQMMEPVTFRPALDLDALPPRDWATTGAAGRPKRIVKSLFLDPAALEAHNDVLQDKYRRIERDEPRWKTYDLDRARVLLVAYGTTARVAYHAMELAEERDLPVGMFRPLTAYPFPYDALRDVVVERGIERILVVELSAGQMIEDVRLAVDGRCPIDFLGRTGGSILAPLEVLEAIRNLEVSS